MDHLRSEIGRAGRGVFGLPDKIQRLRVFARQLSGKIRLYIQVIFEIVTCKYQSVLLSHCASITVRLGCFTMFRLRRRTAAFATVLLAPGLLLPAAAQNVQRVAAANGPDFSACDKIKSPAASAQCYHDADIAHSKGRIAKADTEADCAEAVAALGRNPRAKALGQTLLNGKRPSEFGVCKFRDALVAAMQ